METTFTGSGPKIAVLGDSIMVRTRDELRRELDGFSLKVAATRGEGLAGGAISEATGGGGMVEVAASYAEEPPDVLVIELGTNDAWLAPLTADDAESALAEITEDFPDACTVTVSITETSTAEGYDRSEARQINRALAAVADELVPWGTESTTRGALLQTDGIHPTPEGSALLASSIGEAVRACGT